jgi:hypothetical protein
LKTSKLNDCGILGADPNAELVRHYLIERTPTGHVRLKGCPNEPDFGMKYSFFQVLN